MRHLPLLALLGWAVAIFIASSIPNPPDAGGDEWKYEAAHVFEYAVFGGLAFLSLRTYAGGRPPHVLTTTAWILSVLYGVSDEFHQSFVPNRDANVGDVVFDAAGAIIGIAVAMRLADRWSRSATTSARDSSEGRSRP